MKKFMKGCAITALIFLALGITLAAAAGTVRGRATIARVVETVTGGRVTVNFDNFINWGIQLGDNISGSLPDTGYSIDDAASFDLRYDIMSGDIEKFCLGEGVEALKIEAGGCLFNTRSSGDDCFYVTASDSGKFQAYLENGTLYIRTTTSSRAWNNWNNCKVTLYVPENYHYREAEIELGAGELEFESLNADKVSLGVGAGQITANGLKADSLEMKIGMGQIDMKDVNVKELKVEIGMGSLMVEGAIEGNVDANCSMGNMDLKITGSQQDFNYKLDGAMGNIDLGSESYSGLGVSKRIDNGAQKNMEIECAAGNITINFTN